MTTSDLIVLNMNRDESTGQWMCPVLNKPFTNRTKVVAIRDGKNKNEANVYSYEAYYELNIKAKNYLDLVTGHKFNKDTDVIILQDIENAEHCRLRDIQNFSHIRNLREENNSRQQQNQQSGGGGVSGGDNVRYIVTATRIMEKLDKEKRKRERAAEEQARKLMKSPSSMDGNDDDNDDTGKEGKISIYTDELLTSIHQTSGKASGSLTSTTMDITRENDARLATQDEIIDSQCEQLRKLKKKGMVRMFTNRGAMDIELHCDIVPRTTMNFILLAKKGEYDGSEFHRSIPNFMIQGGKKKSSGVVKKGSEGSSIWDKPFPDEFDDRITHTGSGIVSMANSGPGTNGRQFFITYKSCAHLNRKHTVFGKVVGGIEVLRRLEQVPTEDETDRPLETLKIESIEIIDNPVDEAFEIERLRIQKRKDEKKLSKESRISSSLGGSIEKSEALMPSSKAVDEDGSTDNSTSIGKYVKLTTNGSKKQTAQIPKASNDGYGFAVGTTDGSRLPPPPKKTTFGNFSGW